VDPTDRTPATRAFRHALALDSTNAGAWNWLAMSLAESGDLDGALTGWRRAIASDPSNLQGLTFLSIGHYLRRQYDSSAYWADSAIAVDPTFQQVRLAAGATQIERGDFVRARAAFEAAERLSTDVEAVNAQLGLAMTAARAGAPADARRLLQRAESLSARYTPPPLHTVVWIAEAYAELGDVTRAVAWLQRYAPMGDMHFQMHLRCDPPFTRIENDRRFRSLLLRPRPAGSRAC
jgi:tetratricopeptide (TPR) repeat protein